MSDVEKSRLHSLTGFGELQEAVSLRGFNPVANLANNVSEQIGIIKLGSEQLYSQFASTEVLLIYALLQNQLQEKGATSLRFRYAVNGNKPPALRSLNPTQVKR
jgi:hypothetical protein